jgi:GT2 family glycosyltransferase
MEKTYNIISVIIPTYKSPKMLDLCLTSCIEGQRQDNQIIVIVDGFYDLNKEVLEKWSSYIEILNLEENVGLTRGTNLGVYNSKHEKILIVNDDNVFQNYWDINLNERYQPNSVITPNQIEPFPSMFPQFRINNMGTNPSNFDLEKFWKFCDKIEKGIEDETGSTLPIFMSKLDYLKVGGWDENYKQGLVADWDFFLKCQLSGIKMLRTYNCHFYHFTSNSINGYERQLAEQYGHEYAKYKWGSKIKHNPYTNLKYL